MQTADMYRWFSSFEAKGSSPVFEAWAAGVAEDSDLLALIDQLPGRERQPNLVFAAARFIGIETGPFESLRTGLIERWAEVREVTAVRRTQTNEAGRCSVLLPVFAKIPGPLALIEVGASAGLCLYPDRYRYQFDDRPVLGPGGNDDRPLLRCDTEGPVPVPTTVPHVVWRAGIDLNPLYVSSPDDVRWLETLVWPEQQSRLDRLRAAVEVVRTDPPHLVAGDLIEALPGLVDATPADAQVVVFHSAVLNYVLPDVRDEFIAMVKSLPCHWISNEGPGVVEPESGRLPPSPDPTRGLFTVALDGRALAYADPHGSSLFWFDRTR